MNVPQGWQQQAAMGHATSAAPPPGTSQLPPAFVGLSQQQPPLQQPPLQQQPQWPSQQQPQWQPPQPPLLQAPWLLPQPPQQPQAAVVDPRSEDVLVLKRLAVEASELITAGQAQVGELSSHVSETAESVLAMGNNVNKLLEDTWNAEQKAETERQKVSTTVGSVVNDVANNVDNCNSRLSDMAAEIKSMRDHILHLQGHCDWNTKVFNELLDWTYNHGDKDTTKKRPWPGNNQWKPNKWKATGRECRECGFAYKGGAQGCLNVACPDNRAEEKRKIKEANDAEKEA
jgi:hypothetical protein